MNEQLTRYLHYQAIIELVYMGIETAMIAGDKRLTAEATAKWIDIVALSAEALPDGKVDEIRQLREDMIKPVPGVFLQYNRNPCCYIRIFAS